MRTICDNASGGLPSPGSRSHLRNLSQVMDVDGLLSRPSSTGSSTGVLFTPRTEAAQAPAAASALALAKLATSLLETDVSSSPGRKVIVDAQLGFVCDAHQPQAAGCKDIEKKDPDRSLQTTKRVAIPPLWQAGSTPRADIGPVSSLPRTQVQEEGYVQRHEGQAVIGEPLAPKGQPTKHVAQGSLKDAPQQADIVSLDLMLLDQSAAAEIRRQVSGFGFRLEFRV